MKIHIREVGTFSFIDVINLETGDYLENNHKHEVDNITLERMPSMNWWGDAQVFTNDKDIESVIERCVCGAVLDVDGCWND